MSDTDIKRLTAGKRCKYHSKKKSGTGVIEKVYERSTGHWVTVHDKVNTRIVTVRPSQVKLF
jgi:hypothetical protein